jgi:hypothetical protein
MAGLRAMEQTTDANANIPQESPARWATTTAEVAARWAAAWTTGRRSSLFRLLAANAAIESNLDPDGDFIEILTDFVDAVESISPPSQVIQPGRAILVYDCVAAGETFRLAETLVVDADGLVREVRRVYDLTAVSRLLPGLVEDM